MKMFKKLLKEDEKRDDILLHIEGAAFVIMIICVLTVFPMYRLFPKYIRWLFFVFGVSAFFGFGIRIIWRVRDIIVFKNTVYQDMFEAKEKKREEKKYEKKAKTKQ